MNYDDKDAFFNMYFKFILGDAEWMHQKYPNNIDDVEFTDLNQKRPCICKGLFCEYYWHSKKDGFDC